MSSAGLDADGPRPQGRRPGLRDRKKEQNRRAIQFHAIRLIERQGYARTTVEQIAEAANLSSSTFFRYFRNKDEAVLSDLVAEATPDLATTAPADLNPVQALKYALRVQYETMDDEEWERERRRSELVISVPELQGALLEELIRPLSYATRFVAERLGLPPDSPEVTVYAGAMLGALLSMVLPLASGEHHLTLPLTRQDAIARFDRTFDVLDTMLTAPAGPPPEPGGRLSPVD